VPGHASREGALLSLLRPQRELGSSTLSQIDLLIKLTERYCVVLQTLKNAIPCESTVS